jgi:hypothetical protein
MPHIIGVNLVIIYIKHFPSGKVLTYEYDNFCKNGSIEHENKLLVLGFDGKVYSLSTGDGGNIYLDDLSGDYIVVNVIKC